VSFTLTNFTRHIYVREEMHFNLNNTIPAAGFTATAFDVKAEPALLIASYLRFGCIGIYVSNIIEQSGVGCRIRPRCTPNWGLIDINDLLEMLNSLHFLVFT